MKQKRCSKCKKKKKISNFNKRKASLDGLNCCCRDCENQYSRNHYENNKDYYKQKAQRNDDAIRKWFEEYKSTKKCEICEESDPVTFDFHHIDPSKKEECISVLVGSGSLRKLKEELKKCKVFCANCHRKFHRDNALVV